MAVREKRKAENLIEGLENFSRPVISARSKDLSEMKVEKKREYSIPLPSRGLAMA